MTMTDPIADMLTRIRNGLQASLATVELPSSKIKERLTQILLEEKYIADYKKLEEKGQERLRIYLKYSPDGLPVISGLKRVSKPGLRIYVGRDKIPRVQNGLGTAILSTSKGILPDRLCRKEGVGGEVLCYIW